MCWHEIGADARQGTRPKAAGEGHHSRQRRAVLPETLGTRGGRRGARRPVAQLLQQAARVPPLCCTLHPALAVWGLPEARGCQAAPASAAAQRWRRRPWPRAARATAAPPAATAEVPRGAAGWTQGLGQGQEAGGAGAEVRSRLWLLSLPLLLLAVAAAGGLLSHLLRLLVGYQRHDVTQAGVVLRGGATQRGQRALSIRQGPSDVPGPAHKYGGDKSEGRAAVRGGRGGEGGAQAAQSATQVCASGTVQPPRNPRPIPPLLCPT